MFLDNTSNLQPNINLFYPNINKSHIIFSQHLIQCDTNKTVEVDYLLKDSQSISINCDGKSVNEVATLYESYPEQYPFLLEFDRQIEQYENSKFIMSYQCQQKIFIEPMEYAGINMVVATGRNDPHKANEILELQQKCEKNCYEQHYETCEELLRYPRIPPLIYTSTSTTTW